MTPETVIFAIAGDTEENMISFAKQFIKYHALSQDDVKIVRVEGGVWVKCKRVVKLKSGFIEWLGGLSNEHIM